MKDVEILKVGKYLNKKEKSLLFHQNRCPICEKPTSYFSISPKYAEKYICQKGHTFYCQFIGEKSSVRYEGYSRPSGR